MILSIIGLDVAAAGDLPIRVIGNAGDEKKHEGHREPEGKLDAERDDECQRKEKARDREAIGEVHAALGNIKFRNSRLPWPLRQNYSPH